MQNPHNKKVPFAYNILFAERPHFCWYYEIFLFSVTGFKKWVLFKIQDGKPLASKSLGRFPIEFCSKHIE